MAADLDTALYLAALGFYIAPLQSNSKLPSGHWRQQSTRDVEIIKSWFRDDFLGWNPDINIMIDTGKSGLCVIDVDSKEGKEGGVNWLELLNQHPETPDTYTVETPSGGLHLYYRASGYANTAGKLAKDIDTRGEGGYVVAPSSTIDGKRYGLVTGGEVADLPEWIAEALASSRVKERDTSRVVSSDDAGDIEWARSFLAEHEGAVEGAGGDHHTFVMFCILKEHGLSRDTALELADEIWNEKCSPPWDYDDLARKCESAYKSAQSATGAKSPKAEFEVPVLEAGKPATGGKLRKVLEPFKSKAIPFRDWVYGDMAIRGKLMQITAPGGSSKSTWTMTMAVSKASGKNLLDIDPRGAGRVWLYNNEDDMEELKRRLIAIMEAFGVTWEDMTDEDGTCRLALSSGEETLFQIARRDGRLNKIKPHHADQMVADLIEFNADLLIIDPLAETHPAQENSNDEMKEIGQMFRMVAQRGGVALLLVHHTRKHDNASSEGQSGNMDAARGASALSGLVRSMYTLFQMNEKEAKKYGIAESDRWEYIHMEGAKGNLTKGGFSKWYKRESWALNVTAENPDGESVGIIRPVKLSAQGEDIKPEHKTLMRDIEALTEDGTMGIGEIAKQLVECFPFHRGKKADSLAKAIRRLFVDEGTCISTSGVFHLETAIVNKRDVDAIRFERTAPIESIDAML